MLVLSRRLGQRIVFPDHHISVEVLACKGSVTRLGIKAPAHVNVVREELARTAGEAPAADEARRRHDLRGHLNTVTMALYVAEKQLKAGRIDEAERLLREAQSTLERAPIGDAPATRPSKRPIGALLVEDNRNEEVLLSSFLRLSGVHVDTVHDGMEALEYLSTQKRPLDVVLLDMRLPRFDGPQTVSAIRRDPAHQGLKIFAVTGSSPEEFDLPTGEDGVNAWFQKPLNPRQLVDAMHNLVCCN